MKLENKVVLLTGASSGIGYAIGKAFAKEGAVVYAMARRMEKLEGLKEDSKDLPGEIIPVAGDVVKEEDIDNAVEKALEEQGKIDVLVNNAGVLDEYKSAETITDEIWNKGYGYQCRRNYENVKKSASIHAREKSWCNT